MGGWRSGGVLPWAEADTRDDTVTHTCTHPHTSPHALTHPPARHTHARHDGAQLRVGLGSRAGPAPHVHTLPAGPAPALRRWIAVCASLHGRGTWSCLSPATDAGLGVAGEEDSRAMTRMVPSPGRLPGESSWVLPTRKQSRACAAAAVSLPAAPALSLCSSVALSLHLKSRLGIGSGPSPFLLPPPCPLLPPPSPLP